MASLCQKQHSRAAVFSPASTTVDRPVFDEHDSQLYIILLSLRCEKKDKKKKNPPRYRKTKKEG